jgi:serine/threonine protein kinase
MENNILIDDTCHARLVDFGLTEVYLDAGIQDPFSDGQSLRWKAPEMMNPWGSHLSNSRPSKQGDVYALAMVTWEVR